MSEARKRGRTKDTKGIKPAGKVSAKGVKVIEVSTEKAIIRTIRPEKVEMPDPEKMEYMTKIPIPEGYVRCIVLKGHYGQQDYHKEGDVIDLPERRFKSMGMRGVVKQYLGERQPNKRR